MRIVTKQRVANHFKAPFGVVVNKSDLNKDLTQKVKSEFKGKILGKIGYDRGIIKAIVNLKPVVEVGGDVEKSLSEIFKNVKKRIAKVK